MANKKRDHFTRREFIKTTGKATAGAMVGAGALNYMKPSAFAGKQDNTVIYSMDQEGKVFNPILWGLRPETPMLNCLFDSLLDITPEGFYIPNLAVRVPTKENGGISEDGKVWTFEVKKGVKWHDGHPFTAKDVIFTCKEFVNPNNGAKYIAGLDRIAELRLIDDYNFQATLEKVSPVDYEMFRKPHIAPKHLLEKEPDMKKARFNSNPVGTGPYIFQKWAAGRYVSYKRNPNYHVKGLPKIEKFIHKYVPDNLMMYTQFKAGEIDFLSMSGIPRNRVPEARTIPGVDIMLDPYPSVEFLYLNHSNPKFQDKRVRQALYLAFDKESIVNDIYLGTVKRSLSYMSPYHWAYHHGLKDPGFDPEKAVALLEAAGWKMGPGGIRQKNGVKMSFENNTTTGYQTRIQTQLLMQQQFKDIGVEMTIKNMPGNVLYGDNMTKGKFETILRATGPDFAMMDPSYINHIHSDFIPVKTGKGSNFLQYSNPKLDKLLEDGLAETDRQKRIAIYNKIQELFLEEMPCPPIFNWASVFGKRSNLKGFVQNEISDLGDTYSVQGWYWG